MSPTPPDRRTAARRRLAALVAVAGLAFLGGLLAGADGGEDQLVGAATEAATEVELPRGGRSLLPEHRLVGFYGAPQSDELGALGVGPPSQASARLLEQASAYRGERPRRPVLPVFELLASIAAADPGDDGLYRLRQPHSTIREYLAQARRARGLLLLDVQPGRADFRDEIVRLRRYLREPDVGLALDPEWHVGPTEIPGQVIGSVDAATVNEISARLSRLRRRLDLPEKLLVIHEFTAEMITDRDQLRDRPGIATVLNADGFGDQPNKVSKYRQLRPEPGSPLDSGFKLFYREDRNLMSPEQVLDLRPSPDLIVYE